jgi:chlorite dismutase
MATETRTMPSSGKQATSGELRRQVVSFTFLKVQPEWRRLPREERDEHRREFADVVRQWMTGDQMKVLTYSMVGMRPDCDMMLWRICYTLDCLQEMSQQMLATRLGGYLETPHSFLAMTKRSQYLIGHEHEGQTDSRGVIRPGGFQYLFVYPFVKTRAWYLLPIEQRQRMMSEHIRVGHEFPRVKLNTTYSFGLDDQEFVVAFESNHPEDFVDLVMRLRETEGSAYTLRDTPIFTCVQTSVEQMLERLG